MDAAGKALIARKIPATPELAWASLRRFGGLEKWFPAIGACVVDGEDVGARRDLELLGGTGKMVDYLRAVDNEQRQLTYERVDSPFPVSSYFGTVEVFESFDGLAVIVWTVDFRSASGDQDGIRSLLEDAIGAGVEGLGTYLLETRR